MANTDSPQYPSFGIRSSSTTHNKLLGRSISTKEPSFSEFSPHTYTNPVSLTKSLHASPISSPLHPFSPTSKHYHHHGQGPGPGPGPDHHDPHTTSYRCISSVLKKDGQILSVAASNGLVYTGSQTNVIRVWKVPEFSECGQLKTRAFMVVALLVSHDRVYAAYSDGKIRVWLRTWDGGLKHVRLATFPKSGNYVRNYIAGKDKMVRTD